MICTLQLPVPVLQLPSDESDEREEDDLGVVASMLHELKCESTTVKKVIRLGKRPESVGDSSVDVKSRPIKLVVEV